MTDRAIDKVRSGLKRRYAAERRFRLYGIFAIVVGLGFLATLFTSIVSSGYSAFQQTHIKLDVFFDPDEIKVEGSAEQNMQVSGNFQGLIKAALRKRFPEATSRRDKRALYGILSPGSGYELQHLVTRDPGVVGSSRSIWLTADDDVDMFIKSGNREGIQRLGGNQIKWIDDLRATGQLEKQFNRTLFTAGDSREPEQAGVWGAAVGSFYTIIVTLLLSFPIGAATAIFLEEFAPKSRWTDLIEVNVNNLAAVPSIVFGLLGLAVFINFFGLPRSAPIVGGLVLTLMTLPTIIIAGRAALQSVPPSIREAALGVGASKLQTVFHHVLPLALPGMLTGTIIGMGRALGETAPLLMIGMVAFIVDIPQNALEPSTVLPVQIYLWADSPERGFVERTSAAILVLLSFLIAMNALAVFLRKRFERRW